MEFLNVIIFGLFLMQIFLMILQFRNRIFSILDNIAFIISLIYMLLKFRLIFAFDTQTKVYSINFILNLQIRS